MGTRTVSALQERKASILKSIEGQGKLDDEIRHAIEQARSIKRLEDLYLPYKPRKQTLATLARQRGLEPLAMDLLEGKHSTESLAQSALELVRVDRGVNSLDDVYQGLGHLIAERYSEDVEFRSVLRRMLWKTGRIATTEVAPSNKEEDSASSIEETAVGELDAVERGAVERDAGEAVTEPERRVGNRGGSLAATRC
ncbi:MAG: Tex-like N-terminal domain-containing protein [Pirellulaceae bacterium]